MSYGRFWVNYPGSVARSDTRAVFARRANWCVDLYGY